MYQLLNFNGIQKVTSVFGILGPISGLSPAHTEPLCFATLSFLQCNRHMQHRADIGRYKATKSEGSICLLVNNQILPFGFAPLENPGKSWINPEWQVEYLRKVIATQVAIVPTFL